MTIRNLEYDRFGPWIIEISEADPPPPLFQHYLTRNETPLLSIKIPREIERRAARPGMNLYDYLVTLYQEDLVILERVGNDVRSEVFNYRDIQYIRCGKHLLQGNLYLSTTGKAYDLPFSTVSLPIMQRLINQIRRRYAANARPSPAIEVFDIPIGDLSFYFTGLLEKQKNHPPEFQLLAAQTETPIRSYETGTFRKLLYGIIDKRLMESLHLSDGRELKIITRGKTYKYKGQVTVIYGSDTFYIPLSKTIGITWETDPNNAAVVNLILDTGENFISFTFIRDNPSIPSYARFLSAVRETPQGSDANGSRLMKTA